MQAPLCPMFVIHISYFALAVKNENANHALEIPLYNRRSITMPVLISRLKQLFALFYYIPYLLLLPVLRRVWSPRLISRSIGVVLLFLALEALAEKLCFWAFCLGVAIIEKAFREAFNFAWWVLVATLVLLVAMEGCMILDPLPRGESITEDRRSTELRPAEEERDLDTEAKGEVELPISAYPQSSYSLYTSLPILNAQKCKHI